MNEPRFKGCGGACCPSVPPDVGVAGEGAPAKRGTLICIELVKRARLGACPLAESTGPCTTWTCTEPPGKLCDETLALLALVD